MKKKMSFMVVFMLTVLVFGSMTASAKDIQFEIYRSDGVVWVASNTKDLSGNQFKISNLDTADSDFIEDEDVIGFKVKDYWDDNVSYSRYHTFSRFVDRYPLWYTTTPDMSTYLGLNAQIDSEGQHDSINYEGEWIS
jgi:hypothetical protein